MDQMACSRLSVRPQVSFTKTDTYEEEEEDLLLIRRKYLYEYIQMRLTSYIKIIIK